MHVRLLAVLAAAVLAAAPAHARDFILFESGPVRPIAMSPNGAKLFVTNISDNQLEIFTIRVGGGLTHLHSVPVGMEPVAVATRNDSEVWVVNHLSDSVSVVDVASDPPQVVRTLLVGDEPRDIVFAGAGGDRAFITTAHRGQHRTHGSISGVTGSGDPQLTTPSVPRADVWVFDATTLGATLGGTPEQIVELFGDTPRALAVSNDGNTVYAAVFHSGNQTATVDEGIVCNGFAGAGPCSGDGVTSPNGLGSGNMPGGNPGPSTNHALVDAPEVGLIVQFDNASGEWRDELDRNWSNGIRFHLPDYDVFAIDATTLNQTGSYQHVGTILFNMAVNPANGKVYVSNGDAQNLTRFEGAGSFGGTTVQGNLSQYRITVLSGASTVEPRRLNKHINYAVTPAPAGTKDHSLATPLDMAFTSDGATVYVAAFGSNKIGVFQTATLENDTFDPTLQSAQYIDVAGGGPAGLVLNEAKNRLYTYSRYSNSVSVIDTSSGTELGSVPIHNPEPAHVVAGRPMLYDANLTSSNGEASCSSCHIFGDFDSLAWDLGDPDGDVTTNFAPFTPVPVAGGVNGGANDDEFHPMKGPMTTQTLRGMANSGAMHWRGDRVDGALGQDDPYVNGPGDVGDEDLNFRNFIVAFPGLVGRSANPTGQQMQDFADFALEIALPPNPIRPLDNQLVGDADDGDTLYHNDNMDTQLCVTCHDLDASAGFFGTGGLASFEGETQILKVPHLRNMYQKVGMFGQPNGGFFLAGDNGHKGDQVRGTGFLHDGSTDTLFRFFQAQVFNDGAVAAGVGFDGGDPQRRDMEQFMLEFDTDLAPIVGQQVTLDSAMEADTVGRIGLMEIRAGTSFTSAVLGGTVTECDLVVKARIGGEQRGYLYQPVSLNYVSDRAAEPPIMPGDLQALAATADQELTYTCAPPGSGTRMALDRDEDGVFDGDELDDGTDPANAGSVAGACSDGVDNDGDSLIDLADPGCNGSGSNIENPACDDGVDNDADGLTDLVDFQCFASYHTRETKKSRCGLGFEAGLAAAGLAALRWRRRRRA
ncbi:MAG: hypothetical protein QNK03_23650 [Myxococcota bacterium]|nr:hypothetical protein [Myxococcota bacterium]